MGKGSKKHNKTPVTFDEIIKKLKHLEDSLTITDNIVTELEKKRQSNHKAFNFMFRKYKGLQTSINTNNEILDTVKDNIDILRQRQNMNCGDILGIECTLSHLLDSDFDWDEEEETQDAEIIEENEIEDDKPLLTQVSGVTDESDVRQAIIDAKKKKDADKAYEDNVKEIRKKDIKNNIKKSTGKLEGYNLSQKTERK